MAYDFYSLGQLGTRPTLLCHMAPLQVSEASGALKAGMNKKKASELIDSLKEKNVGPRQALSGKTRSMARRGSLQTSVPWV